jgi:hypothetical protein
MIERRIEIRESGYRLKCLKVPEKAVTRSFRINESAFLALEEEAPTKASSIIASNITISYRNSSFILSYHRMNVDEAS